VNIEGEQELALKSSDRILFPKTLSDCLNWFRRRPNSKFLAGATDVPSLETEEYFLSLHFLEELKRVFRGDRFLELGSMVSLNRSMKLLSELVHPNFVHFISSLDTAPLRNQATIGGNLMSRGPGITLFPYLGLIDTKVELRKSGTGRWISLFKLNQEGSESNNELISRIRIPLSVWNWQKSHLLKNEVNEFDLGIFMMAQVHNGIIEDFRSSIVLGTSFMIRDRSFDAEFVGQSIPISQKDAKQLSDDILELLNETVEESSDAIVKEVFTNNFIKEQIQRYYRFCLVQNQKSFLV
jgi:CO/xanthine dehydrogenase FAD-binding subunit